jgi:hypothetical protein
LNDLTGAAGPVEIRTHSGAKIHGSNSTRPDAREASEIPSKCSSKTSNALICAQETKMAEAGRLFLRIRFD